MENKEIWWCIHLMMQCYVQTKHNREMNKKLYPAFPKVKQTWNYEELQEYNSYCYRGFSILSGLKLSKFFEKIRMAFWSISSQIPTILS